MTPPSPIPASNTENTPHHALYVPGHATAKLGVALLGVALLIVGFQQLWPFLHLAFGGGRAMAESVHAVALDANGKETVLANDAELKAKQKSLKDARDHSQFLFIVYRFTTTEGTVVKVRSPIGKAVEALHPLRDDDGLPRTIDIWYDKTNPQHIAIPFQFLTAAGAWIPFGFQSFFIPGMILLFGSIAVFIGLVLWRNANKPIEMPDLSQSHGEDTKRLPSAGH